MKKNIKLVYIFSGLIVALLLAGCGTSGSSSGSVSVYAGYGYPAYGYGYNYGCCYYNNPSRPYPPGGHRPVKPPGHRPGGPVTGRPVRPSQPMARPARGGGGRRR